MAAGDRPHGQQETARNEGKAGKQYGQVSPHPGQPEALPSCPSPPPALRLRCASSAALPLRCQIFLSGRDVLSWKAGRLFPPIPRCPGRLAIAIAAASCSSGNRSRVARKPPPLSQVCLPGGPGMQTSSAGLLCRLTLNPRSSCRSGLGNSSITCLFVPFFPPLLLVTNAGAEKGHSPATPP